MIGPRAMAAVAAVALLAGCPKKPVAPGIDPALQNEPLLVQARGREVPPQLTARISLKLRSKPLGVAGTTGGGLVVDRPTRGRLDALGPVGGSLLTVVVDGDDLAILLPGDRTRIWSQQADAALREATGGVAGVDDVFALLVGDLPLDDAPVVRRAPAAEVDGATTYTFAGPDGAELDVTVTPDALLASVAARDAEGASVLTATYDRWKDVSGVAMPGRVDLRVPALELSATLTVKAWRAELPAVDGLFATTAPDDGWSNVPLEVVLRRFREDQAEP